MNITPKFLINRELSALEFNQRVLAQALDPAVPLLDAGTLAALIETHSTATAAATAVGIGGAAAREPDGRRSSTTRGGFASVESVYSTPATLRSTTTRVVVI